MVLVVWVDFTASRDPRLARISFRMPQFFRDTGFPFREENLYIRTLAYRLSENSIRTFAEHLKELLLWRLEIGCDLKDFSEYNLDYYVDAQCSYVKASGNGLSWNTVNARIASAHRFLIWCRVNNFNHNIALERLPKTGLGSKVAYKIRVHPSKRIEEPTRFLPQEKAVELIRVIGEKSAKDARVRTRNSLIAKLMLQCGLRLSEATRFPVCDLPEINHSGLLTPARIVGKGSKPRMILIPNRLLSDLWSYANLARESILDNLASMGMQSRDSHLLFISEQGRGITGNWVEKVFARAAKHLGLKAKPHDLRHSFGTYHYFFHKDILFLSQLMGHESQATTEKYYLHAARLIAYSSDYEQLQREIDELCSEIN